MSEDTAHGQHFEPGPPPARPVNGEATGAEAQQAGAAGLTLEEALAAQTRRVEQLAQRTAMLISTTQDAFRDFVFETGILFTTLQSLAKEIETNGNRPSDSATTQTST